MILKIYSVFDSAAGAFLQPFFAPTDGLAIRSFMDALNDNANALSKHAADYTLYLLGEFNDADASFSPPQEPVKLMTGLDAQMRNIN